MLDDQLFCPSCSEDTDHVMIKSGQENLVRCEECGMVHSIQKEKERLVNLKVIVSKDAVSQPYRIQIPEKEKLEVGQELLVDDASQDLVLAEITSIETDRRVESALAKEAKTIWARALDEVPLKISVYRAGRSYPIKIHLPGDEVFALGDVREVEGSKFRIVKIKLRGAGFADEAPAKNIVRIWGQEL
jgi:uncharacterized Zn finger protein